MPDSALLTDPLFTDFSASQEPPENSRAQVLLGKQVKSVKLMLDLRNPLAPQKNWGEKIKITHVLLHVVFCQLLYFSKYACLLLRSSSEERESV